MVVVMVVGTRTASRNAGKAGQASNGGKAEDAHRALGAAEHAESNGSSKIGRPACCSLYHRAVELVGRRWTGAILLVLMDGPLRFGQIKQLVPDLSDRLLSERLKELEGEGIVTRYEESGGSARAQYGLTAKGRALEPAVRALKTWANTHL